SFSNSELKLASLSGVYLWRVRHANCSDARVIAPKLEAALSLKQNAYSEANTVPVTSDEIEKFIEDYVADIGNDRRKHEARERLREGLVSTIEKDDLAKIETSWRDCAANSEKITESDYLKQHADFLRDLVCNASFA